MKDKNSIIKMFTRFTDIINGLKALGKVYEESQKVMKILRSFPKQWKVKVMIIQNVKNLIKLPLQWLISSLMTQEIKMKSHQEMEDKNKKSITPKAFIIKEKKKKNQVKKMRTI